MAEETPVTKLGWGPLSPSQFTLHNLYNLELLELELQMYLVARQVYKNLINSQNY